MTGETNLDVMLASLTVLRRNGQYVVTTLADRPSFGEGVEAIIRESEGFTVVCSRALADEQGWAYEYVAAWLTLEVHSALEAVGLTAAFSAVLAEHGLSCNVIAGYYHDHILVPHDRAAEAIAAIESARS